MEYYEKCKRQKREDISYCQFYNDSNCKKTCNYAKSNQEIEKINKTLENISDKNDNNELENIVFEF